MAVRTELLADDVIMEPIPQFMQDHMAADLAFQEKMTVILSTLATKEDIAGLATEASVRDVVHWQKNIVLAGETISFGGRLGYRTILVVATLLGALAVITGAWKAVFLWFIPK